MDSRARTAASESRVRVESSAYNRPRPLNSLTTWTSDGLQNRTLQTEEIPQQPGIPDELCQTRSRVEQVLVTCGLVFDASLHGFCSRWWTVRSSRRWYICQPIERAARPRLRLSARH